MGTLLGYARFALDALYAHLMKRPRVHAVAGIGILLILIVLFVPPIFFPSGGMIEVHSDTTFREVAQELADAHIIHSATVLRGLARLTGTDDAVQAGRYSFPSPVGSVVVLYRLAHGITMTPMARVTFPEGTTVRDMADILSSAMPGFDEQAFLTEARPYEGYLFPDTYEFPPDASADDVVMRMRLRFKEVWGEIEEEAARFAPGTTLRAHDSLPRIVTMASLLEKETKLGEDREIVSGILWHRVDIGMALQVDAVFGYIKGIDTYHPSGNDLEIDSAYNTYMHKDLPPGPIGNPGKDALRAALMPKSSPYLYYLSDGDGKVHYAKTFDEHKANKAKYLK